MTFERLLLVATSISLLLGCSRSEDSPDTARTGNGTRPRIDSESHFLSYCSEGCPEGLRCACGVCTRVCTESDECDEFGDTVECVPPTPAEPTSCLYTQVRKVCDARCESNADCGEPYVCDLGVCRQAPPATDTCPAPMTPACSPSEQLDVREDEQGCVSLACVPLGVCHLPFWQENAPRCDATGAPRYWFDVSHGRCGIEDTGGCGTTENSFTTLEECWSTCAAEYQGTCIDAWDPAWETADVPSYAENNLLRDPVTVSRAQALALVSGDHSARLTYPDGTQTDLIVSVTEAVAYHVTSRDNPVGSSAGLGPHCWDRVVVEARVRFVTADGRFDEEWQRVPFTVGGWDAYTHVELWVEGDWWPARPSDEPLRGSYRPALDPNTCSVGSQLGLTLYAGAARGQLNHTLAAVACDQVTESTGIGNPTPADGEPARPPRFIGPAWSTLQMTTPAQWCAVNAPNLRGPNEIAASTEGGRALFDDPEPDELLFQEVLTQCQEFNFPECRPEAFLTWYAAECIAEAVGLDPGPGGWNWVLSANYEAGRVLWNHLELDATGQTVRTPVSVDAVTGEIIDSLL
jgi:hypothetical protein